MSPKPDIAPTAPVALIAALPEEIKPLLARVGFTRREQVAGFPLHRCRLGDHELILLRSGMGPKNAAEATHALLNSTRPKLIINFGLGGGVAPGPRVADLVLATRLLVSSGGEFHEQAGLTLSLVDGFLAATASRNCRRGTFITAGETMPKAALREALPTGTETPLLEMETAAIARVADEHGIPLLAIRAVSDDCNEELGFTVAEFCDENLQIRPSKVLLAILKNPWIIPQLIRLARDSKLAAEALAAAIASYLEQHYA